MKKQPSAGAVAEADLSSVPRALLLRLTESTADRWIHAPTQLFLSLNGEEDVPETLDREHIQQARMCVYAHSVQRPPQMPSRMPDLSTACSVLLWTTCTATWLYSQHCYQIFGSEVG